jgi:hypothetical protein
MALALAVANSLFFKSMGTERYLQVTTSDTLRHNGVATGRLLSRWLLGAGRCTVGECDHHTDRPTPARLQSAGASSIASMSHSSIVPTSP